MASEKALGKEEEEDEDDETIAMEIDHFRHATDDIVPILDVLPSYDFTADNKWQDVSFYFRPPRVIHTPPRDGIISSRIRADGSNTIRFTTALESPEMYIPEPSPEMDAHVHRLIDQNGGNPITITESAIQTVWKD